MNVAMIMLVGFGLAFDVFYIAVSQGCVLGTVRAKSMTLMCLIVCGWQSVAIGLGYAVASLPKIYRMSEDIRMVWTLLSALIFITLGVVKIYINNHKTAMPEVRQEVNFRKICRIASTTSIYTLFAGIAGEWIMLNVVSVSIMICLMTIALVILGVYVGYRNGELDKRMYWSGGILLIIAGLLVIFEYLLWWFGR